jgi:tetratricopeptide (TPR) repeat protein
VRHLVDEMVVCDTGSGDNTVTIAAEYGARVVTFDWCDDFAAARNAALDAVTSDWVLVLDADEVLTAVDPDYWSSLLNDPEAAGYELTMSSRVGEERRDFNIVRLFRNNPAVRYCFPVHEQVVPALNVWAAPLGLKVKPSLLVIDHAGYEPHEREAKRPRNRRLLEKAVADHPTEPYLRFQLGAESVVVFEGEVLPVEGLRAARAHLAQAWHQTRGTDQAQLPWLPVLAGLLASAETVCGQPYEALEIIGEAGRSFPEHPNLALPLCLAVLASGGAAALHREITGVALQLDKSAQGRVLGELEIALGHGDLAAPRFQAVLDEDPDDTFALLGMGRCWVAQGRHREALPLILKAVDSSAWNWRAWLQGISLMEHLGLAEKAQQWRATFAREFPEHPVNL